MAIANNPRKTTRSDSSNGHIIAHPDLEWREIVQGTRPGDRFIKIGTHRGFRRVRPGYVISRPDTGEPHSPVGRILYKAKRTLIGRPISTHLEIHERLTKIKALAVYSSDVLSSVAYATEEIMKVLVLGGLGLLSLTTPISLLIVTLLAIVVLSYTQTIKAYPSGGGSYIVASDNLGTLPGLTAAAALLIDYVLTVAVSVAAGVAAITSLMPDLLPLTFWMGIGAVLFITIANLRGVRESGTILALPTYVFITIMYLLIGYGIYKLAAGSLHYIPPADALRPGSQSLGLFMLMSAFA